MAQRPVCQHCGGYHVRTCPRVRSMQWHPNGTIAKVVFWPPGRWPEDLVLFLDTDVAHVADDDDD